MCLLVHNNSNRSATSRQSASDVLSTNESFLLSMLKMLETLSKILLCEVAHGKVVSEPFAASKLWSQAPAVVFVVRRPG